MNCTHLVSVEDEDATFTHIVGGVCDVIKQQPWIVMGYCLLERQIYCKYVNNKQREGTAVLNEIKKYQ